MRQDREPWTRRLAICLCATLAVAATGLTSSIASGAKLRGLYSFCVDESCFDGLNPVNGLLRDVHGNLYGETTEGGAYGHGTVFQLHRLSGKDKYELRVLRDFCTGGQNDCVGGAVPGTGGHVAIDTKGNIYVAASGGGKHHGGVVFRLIPHNGGKRWSYRALYDFCAVAVCVDGQDPASLTYAGAATGEPYDGVSPLYGVAEFGGKNGSGAAFVLKPKAQGRWSEQVIYNFCSQADCADGSHPAHDLLLDSGGNLLGVTRGGGVASDAGVVFKMSPAPGSGWKETVLHAFCSMADCADGKAPSGGLVVDSNGNLFGLTAYGGNPDCSSGLGCGVAYKIAAGGAYSVMHAFCDRENCVDGDRPDGRLAIDTAGNLFGITDFGGAHQGGTAFRLRGGKHRVIFDFCSGLCDVGPGPRNGVTLDPDGNLYGTAGGGEAGIGVAYRLTQ